MHRRSLRRRRGGQTPGAFRTREGLSSGDDFYLEVLWRSALALVNAREGRADEAILLSDEAVKRANAGDALLFRAITLESAATVHDLLGDREAR